MKSIDIDFEVYKGLTTLLETEEDTYNDALRRLLNLSERQPEVVANNNGNLVWVSKGYVFPEGTEFQATFKGNRYAAEIKDGKLVYNGEIYNSFSGAAMAVTGGQRNGWDFWEMKAPGKTRWKKLY